MSQDDRAGKEARQGEITPGKEPRPTFLAVLSILRQLAKDGILCFRVDPLGNAELDVNMQAFAQAPDEMFSDDLPRDFFLRIVHTEMSALTNVAVEEDAEKAIRLNFPPSVVKDVGTEEIRWRASQAREAIIPEDLKERVKLRRTAKAAVYEDVTWEISVKEHDEREGGLSSIPFASVCITYSDPLAECQSLTIEGEGASVSLPIRAFTTRRLTLELHQADVQYLVDKLTILRDSLSSMRERK